MTRTARFLVLMIASEATQFSRGQLIGPGCCRTMGGGLRAWYEPSTAEAIAAKRVHDRPMNHTACAVECAELERCTHFELNMHDQPAHSKQGVCSVFASGGYSVTTACRDSSARPRMHCFEAANLRRRNVKKWNRLSKHDGVSAQSFLRSAWRGKCAALLKRPGAYGTAACTVTSFLRAVLVLYVPQRHRQLHLAPRCHALYVPPYKVRGTWHHRCADYVTNRDTPRSNCEHGQQGTFSLGYLPSWSAMAGACLRRCAACKGCSFISLSVWTTKITRTRDPNPSPNPNPNVSEP